MISISPLSSGTVPVLVPAARQFRAPVGRIHNVRFEDVPYIRTRGNTAAREAGLRFEAKVQEHFTGIWPGYFAGPILHFTDDRGHNLCIPDGILLLPDRVVVFEIKSQHMPEAWWQLCRKYRPVVEVWQTDRPVQGVEVVRSYDPAMPFPCPVRVVESPTCIFNLSSKDFCVLVWKDK